MSNITIITAFFDIGRSDWNKTIHGIDTPAFIPRKTEAYFNYFELLSKVKNDMIIYCDDHNSEKIMEIRKRNAPESLTQVVSINFQDTIKTIKPVIERIQRRSEYINFVDDPRMPEYWNADYVLVNYMKTDFVINAYESNYIKNDLAAWLDFGYVRGVSTLPDNLEWNYNFDLEKIHYFNKIPVDMVRPIFDIVKTNTVYIMGCHIVAGKNAWYKHKIMNQNSLASLINCGLIDDDQTIMLMNYRSNPKEFELHHINVKNEIWNEWNIVMKNYNISK